MSENKYITEAKRFHRNLMQKNCVIESTYQGLTVYKVNLAVGEENALINLRNYFYTESTIHNLSTNITPAIFKDWIKPENKKGICLHYTAGQITGSLQWLTGAMSENPYKDQYTSVPFMICHAGYIYQLCDPDTDLAWHLSPKIHDKSRCLHNQIIGIELFNYGHEVVKYGVPEDLIVTLPQKHRGQSRFETFTVY